MSDESKPPMRQIAELIDGIATARAEDATALLRIAEMQAIEARLGEKAALETIADRDAQIARVKALLDSAISDCIDRDAEIARLKAALDSESTLRQCREEQLRLLHQDYAGCVGERDAARHEVETWQREYSGALADFEHAQAEIARLKDHVDAASETAGNAIREVIDLRRANAQLDAGIARLEAELSEALSGVAERQKTIDVMLESRKRDRAEIAPPPAEDPRIAALCVIARHLIYHANYRGNQAFDDALLIVNEGRR